MAVPAHQAGRADHRGQAGHRRGSGRGVSQAVALEAALSGSVGDPAPDVSTPVLYDISPLIDAALAVWPGDTPPSREVLLDIASGHNITLSTLRATVHLGAHADAPSHYGSGGADIASVPLEHYLGPCEVMRVDAERGGLISPAMLPRAVSAPRLLIATGTFPDPAVFDEDFAALSAELVRSEERRVG